MEYQKWQYETQYRYEDLDLCSVRGKKVIIKTNTKSNLGLGGAWVEGLGDVDAGAINLFVKGYELLAKTGRSDLNIDPEFTYEGFSCGWPKIAVILDKESTLKLREFSKLRHEAMIKEGRERRLAEKKKLAETVPGLEELEATYNAEARYRAKFADAMEDEYNDGVSMPEVPQADIKALEAKYPRAALYIKADDYCSAENHAKASAGEKAKAVLVEGGSLEDAAALLDNWTKDVVID